ncbi:hypothetical protein [Burkholderia stagnalis]|uniref:hypothetical protein n=1 Tax=Burkholderia stagnalis TaxID=1503054 RepID=UPI000759AD1B|nr:hypothetical protein [Burkholderia stagnalis]KVX62437.1 hypothetical protein WT33_13990 [Burkholderia stagnalis]
MKERPILFSGPMVRAILEGRKTQTRRVMKPQPVAQNGWVDGAYWERRPARGIEPADQWCIRDARQFCPHGTPGDRLWVRETHDVNRLGSETFPDGRTRLYAGIAYQADDGRHEADISDSQCRAIEAKKWRGWTPSIHMPRWASRITLEITGVRVERLQSIRWDDAIAEGIPDPRRAARRVDPVEGCVAQFRALWDGLNAARGYGWDQNPWAWVIEFRRIEA